MLTFNDFSDFAGSALWDPVADFKASIPHHDDPTRVDISIRLPMKKMIHPDSKKGDFQSKLNRLDLAFAIRE